MIGSATELPRFSLVAAPASPQSRRIAFAAVAISSLAFIAGIPFAQVRLPAMPAFIASYEAALAFSDLVTFLLLFGMFQQSRTGALLALAAGYLFDASMTIPHALSFPGLYASPGLLGATRQTTAWLYMFWHGGFPIFVIAYGVLQDRADTASRFIDPVRIGKRAAGLFIAAVPCAVAAVTLLAVAGNHLLPAIMQDNGYTAAMKYVVLPVWALSIVALLVLWHKRVHSVIDLWLMVVMFAWLFDVAMSAVLNGGRFDLGFYAGRAYGLLAATFVLGVILGEANRLHGRLAVANDALADQARTLHASVRERTKELQRSVDALELEIRGRKQAEAQLVQAQKMEAIGNLTGGMAHDFNNILGVVIGNLDLARSRLNDDEETGDLLGDALEASLKGADLTQRLLAFARQQPLQPELIEINPLIAGMVKLLRRTLGEAIEISFNEGADVWAVIADPAQLEASITNLATNARDAMPKGGKLTIVTANRHLDDDYAARHPEVTAGDYVLVEVSDTGIGMKQEVASRIFDPFYTTKARGKGTGLGLSMVFGFMKQSGGHISVYSEPRIGTTFRLYLPRANDGVHAKPRVTAPDTIRGNGEIILVVEDNAALRRVVVKQLIDLGYRVLEADTAAAALVRLEREQIDLLFTDIVMPGEMDGFELANVALTQRPGLKVLVTSGFPESRVTEDFGPTRGARLLIKPYRQVDLAQALRQTLDVPSEEDAQTCGSRSA